MIKKQRETDCPQQDRHDNKRQSGRSYSEEFTRVQIMNTVAFCVPAIGAIGLAFSAYRYWWVVGQDSGTAQMQQIAGRILRGAMAFLKAEY